jgi:ABC-type phosphate/phosphonate transport system substrate-binding protein
MFCVLVTTCLSLLMLPSLAAPAQKAKIELLKIGTSGSLVEGDGKAEKSSLESLRSFIKDETGLANEIVKQKNWRELADKMAKGEYQLGVFQGYEFAWAQEKKSDLKALALAINAHPYPVVSVLVQKDGMIKDFAALEGQSFALPATGQRYLRLFVERQAKGKELEKFFSKISAPDIVEDALDGVVDGTIKAAVVEKGALEAFKRRKPARFAKLKEIAKSQPLPPVIVAYYGNSLDDATLKRVREGLLTAANKERGETLLTLFRLTGFVLPPSDFNAVIAQTRKDYAPPDTSK